GIIRYPLVMQVNPSFPARTVPEFISYVKSNPGKISYGSGGIGTSIHVASELFKMMAGVDMIHVPYRGGAPAMTDLMADQVQVVFNPVPESMEFIRAGKLRPLAVTTATRSEVLPDIPTVGDFVPGYEASALQGIGAPKETPAEIVDKLNKEINAGLADAKLKARFADLGAAVFPGSSSDFGKFMAEETEKWAKVIKFSGANYYADRAADAQHPVCAAHHLRSVRHADPSHLKQPELRVDLSLLFDVEMGRAFIQKQEFGLTVEGTREQHALLLAAGERAAHIPDQAVVGHRHVHDLVVDAGNLRTFDHPLLVE